MEKLTRVQRKRRKRRIFLRIILFIFLLFIMVMFVLKIEYFSINNIVVMGNNKISKKTIIDISKIEKKENIFKISIKNSEENIEKSPYVKEVTIKRKLPKSIIIKVMERKEVLQAKKASSYIILDKEGYILNVVDEKVNKLPLLIGIEVKNKLPGDNIFSDIKSMNTKFVEAGENINLLSQIEEINILENNNINIILFNGIDVAFGTIDNVEYKLNILKEILKDIEKRDLKCKRILMDRGENPVIVLEDEEG